jgi:hypothetical protein
MGTAKKPTYVHGHYRYPKEGDGVADDSDSGTGSSIPGMSAMGEDSSGGFGSGFSNGTGISKKVGPLPIWGWVLVAVASYYFYRKYTSSATASSSAPSTNSSGAIGSATTAGGTSSDLANSDPTANDALLALEQEYSTLSAQVASSGASATTSSSGSTPGVVPTPNPGDLPIYSPYPFPIQTMIPSPYPFPTPTPTPTPTPVTPTPVKPIGVKGKFDTSPTNSYGVFKTENPKSTLSYDKYLTNVYDKEAYMNFKKTHPNNTMTYHNYVHRYAPKPTK